MDEDLVTLISKLRDIPTEGVINLDSPRIPNHLRNLKKRLVEHNYTEPQLMGLAILLQHYSLDDFTKGELMTLLELDLSSLEYHTDVEYEPVMSTRLRGVMDTGSLRVYGLLGQTGGRDVESIDYLKANSYTAYQYVKAQAGYLRCAVCM